MKTLKKRIFFFLFLFLAVAAGVGFAVIRRWSPDREELFLRAGKGDAAAQYEAGILCATGKGGIRKDLSAAAEWYRKSAEGGNPDAMLQLARAYR